MLKLKLQLPEAKSRLIGKDPDARKDWRQEEKGTSENEMFGWHDWLGHEFEQALGVGDGQGRLTCYIPWGHKESDITEQLNWTESEMKITLQLKIYQFKETRTELDPILGFQIKFNE